VPPARSSTVASKGRGIQPRPEASRGTSQCHSRPSGSRRPDRRAGRGRRGLAPPVLRVPAAAITCANGLRVNQPRHLPSAVNWPRCWSRVVTMLPPDAEGPLEGGLRQNIATATAKRQRPSPVVMVKQETRWHRYLVASASLYAPACDRTWWWISLRCPWCGSVHLHRVRREEDADGVRRTGCGRKVFVRIRRTYRSKVNPGAAA